MTEIQLQPFLALRRHLRVAHHIPGRIRLRVAPTIIKDLGVVDDKMLDRVLGALNGIKNVRVNPRAGSAVVDYIPEMIPPHWWETLLHGQDAAAVELMRHLLENELAPAVAAARSE